MLARLGRRAIALRNSLAPFLDGLDLRHVMRVVTAEAYIDGPQAADNAINEDQKRQIEKFASLMPRGRISLSWNGWPAYISYISNRVMRFITHNPELIMPAAMPAQIFPR